jgi:hypothetical protein
VRFLPADRLLRPPVVAALALAGALAIHEGSIRASTDQVTVPK